MSFKESFGNAKTSEVADTIVHALAGTRPTRRDDTGLSVIERATVRHCDAHPSGTARRTPRSRG
jgi:hypothetical protein